MAIYLVVFPARNTCDIYGVLANPTGITYLRQPFTGKGAAQSHTHSVLVYAQPPPASSTSSSIQW